MHSPSQEQDVPCRLRGLIPLCLGTQWQETWLLENPISESSLWVGWASQLTTPLSPSRTKPRADLWKQTCWGRILGKHLTAGKDLLSLLLWTAVQSEVKQGSDASTTCTLPKQSLIDCSVSMNSIPFTWKKNGNGMGRLLGG